jgi:adenylate kinase
MKDLKKTIILLGPPGSGKGTQGQLLAEKYGLYFFETSKFIEEIFNSGKEFLETPEGKFYIKDEKQLRESGKLCSPAFVFQIIIDNVKRLHDMGESILFSGSPRTMYEAEKLTKYLQDLYSKDNLVLFALEMDPQNSIDRNSNRRICQLMRHSILYNDDTKDLHTCPLDGSNLIKRDGVGDDPQTIKTRLDEYKVRTEPIIDYIASQGIKTIKIDASKTPVEVFNSIIANL